MRFIFITLFPALLAVLASGCGEGRPDDGFADTSAPDTSVADTALEEDTALEDEDVPDATMEDTDVADAELKDTAKPDADVGTAPDADVGTAPDADVGTVPDADAGTVPDAGSDAGSDAEIGTVPVPMREALLVYTRNHFDAPSDKAALTPYLAYVDSVGQVLEPYLYDTFVLLDLGLIRTARPTVKAWSHFLDMALDDAPPAALTVIPVVTQRSGSQGAALQGDGQRVSQAGIPVTGGETYAYEVFTRSSAELTGREALIGVIVRDAQGAAITSGITGLVWSDYIGQWYHYLPSSPRWALHQGQFTVPAEARSIDIEFRQFNAPGAQVSVDRAQLVRGAVALTFELAVAQGYATLIHDGDFDSGTPWDGFVAAEGLERGLHIRGPRRSAAQGPLPVTGGATYTFAASLRSDEPGAEHEALLGVQVFDGAGVALTTGVTGLNYSTATTPNMFYTYADATRAWGPAQTTFTLPAAAASVVIYVVDWAGDGVWADRLQLVEGTAPLSDAALRDVGYETLVSDGSAEIFGGDAWWEASARTLPSGRGFFPALSDVAASLGDRRKRNVILGLPVGSGFTTMDEFGEVDGRWLDLTRPADREEALRWFIDEAVARWTASPPPGLDLVGFYWTHESRDQDPQLAAYAQAQAASHGLMLTGSPYRGFGGSSACFGSTFAPDFASHFDRIWQQPNVWPPSRWSMTEAVWDNVHTCLCEPVTVDDFVNVVGYPTCELATVGGTIDALQSECDALSSTAQIHANIEWVSGLEATGGHGRVQDYMNSAGDLTHDYGRFADRMWYEDAGFGRRCALDPDPVFRAQYDAVREFIEAGHLRHGFPAP